LKNRILSIILWLVFMILFIGASSFAQDDIRTKSVQNEKKAELKMEEIPVMHPYLLMFPHTSESCLATLDKISGDSPELLNKIDWGCKSGDHTGYIILDGKNEADVLQMIPTALRSSTKVEQVNKFSMTDIEALHQKH
jgi:hypothetical protein